LFYFVVFYFIRHWRFCQSAVYTVRSILIVISCSNSYPLYLPSHRAKSVLYVDVAFVTSRKREAEGRKPGWTEHGIDDNEGSGSSDDDSSDDEDDAKKKPAPTPEATAIAAKKKAAAAGPPEGAEAASASDGPPKLKSMDIKKMNGDALKEALKERGLDIQGQKKDLMKRLLDFEAARA
jgi:hypothetical protein